MGNAYLKRFFDFTHDMHDIRKSLNAYNSALKDTRTHSNADVYYYRAVVHEYLENFQQASVDYQKAMRMDPSLASESSASLAGIYLHISQMSDLITQKAHWKAKKLETTAASIKGKCSDTMANLKVVTLSQLVDDSVNRDCIIFGKILAPVPSASDHDIRRAWVAITPGGQLFGISVYNISSSNLMSSGDEIVISNPHLKTIHMETDYAQYINMASMELFQCVRVENPMTMCVEGLPPRSDMLASVGIHVYARSHT